MSELSKDIHEKIIDIRRYLHSVPEIGFDEIKTSKFIKEKLTEYGFEVYSTAKTGVIGFKKGTSNDKSIAFRADMDALRVTEETNLPYASKEDNMMHACGHDGHMSILLGLAMYISKLDSINRDIVLIFQPAEEGPGGAKIIIEEGILEKYNVESIFGLHILPDINEGTIGVKPGPIMAQTGELDITIKAKSGHGAMPHTAIDGIYVASQLINSYQSIVSRNIEPIEGAVLTIGEIHGGEARNVIAHNVTLKGTIRAFNDEVYKLIKERMLVINESLEKMYNVKITTEIRDMYPAVINDENLFQMFKEILNEDELILLKPMMISEDFSYYQQKIPGIFFMLGSRNEKLNLTYPLHNSKFNFNENILMHGVKTYIKICEKLNIF